MRYINDFKILILFNILLLSVSFVYGDKPNEQLTESSLNKATIVDHQINAAETKLKESESAGHKKMEIKEEKGQSEKLIKENDYKKSSKAHGANQSSDVQKHDHLKASEENSKLKKKQSDELGHDEGKKTASKTKKSGDHLDEHWDRGHGFVKQWNFDRGSKKKKSTHLVDEGKLKKYNKAYKAENGMVSKGHHKKYKKHDAGYKNGWGSNHWNHNRGAYGHDLKKRGGKHNGYYSKKKANAHHHDSWHDNGWQNDHSNKHHDEHDSGYDWRFK